jgi:putative membrane protein
MRIASLLVLHIFGLVLWISGLLGTTIVFSKLVQESSAEARRALVRTQRVMLRAMADPGAFATLAAGIALVAMNPSYYLYATWLYIKLVLVVILIGLHVIIALKGKSAGTRQTALGSSGQMRIVRALILLVFFFILVATLPGEVFLR